MMVQMGGDALMWWCSGDSVFRTVLSSCWEPARSWGSDLPFRALFRAHFRSVRAKPNLTDTVHASLGHRQAEVGQFEFGRGSGPPDGHIGYSGDAVSLVEFYLVLMVSGCSGVKPSDSRGAGERRAVTPAPGQITARVRRRHPLPSTWKPLRHRQTAEDQGRLIKFGA